MPLGLDQKVGALVWSPLGWGRLTGKVRRGKPLPKVSRLHKDRRHGPAVSDEHLYTVVDALIRWLPKPASRPAGCAQLAPAAATVSSVVIGARNEQQLRQNLAAEGWNLTAEQVAAARQGQRATRHLPLLAPAPVH